MRLFRTRKARISVDFTARVCLQNKQSGKLTESSLLCTVSSLSNNGACLILEKMVLEGEHLFFSAQQQSEHLLYIKDFSIDLGIDEPRLQGVAIWMDSCIVQDKKAFKVGVEFVEKQDQLIERLKKGTKNK